MEKRAHLRRLSGGSGCDNGSVILSRLHRCIAGTTASTAAAYSGQLILLLSTLHIMVQQRDHSSLFVFFLFYSQQ